MTPYVEYPRVKADGRLPPASLEQLQMMARLRSKASLAVILAIGLGPINSAIWMVFAPLQAFEWVYDLLLTPWIVGHIFATVLTYSSIAKATAGHASNRWLPMIGTLFCFLLPCVGLIAPLAVVSWTSGFFKVRKIDLGLIRPSEDDLETWARIHPLENLETE